MADVLQEFLVSVKYAIDATSQNRLLDALKRVSASALGTELKILGLVGSLVELTRRLAEAGEQWYWMSQRMGESVSNLVTATDAMTQLGVSAGEAKASFEGFGYWVRSQGPAATAFLGAFGITAKSTQGQLEQMAQTFRRYGGADPNSPMYWFSLQLARMWNIPEMEMRAMASGAWARQEARRRELGMAAWGVGSEEARSDRMQKWAEQANKVMTIFREFGFVLADLSRYFGARLFDILLPKLQALFSLMMSNLPAIRYWLDAAAKAIGVLFDILTATFGLLSSVFQLVTSAFREVMSWLDIIPPALQHLAEALVVIGALVMRSPFGLWITALSALLLLINDYMVWKQHGLSRFDWKGFDTFKTEIDGLIESVTGLKDGLWKVVAPLLVIATLVGPGRLFRWGIGGLLRLLGLGGAAAGAAGAAGGAAAGAAGAGAAAAAGRMGLGGLLLRGATFMAGPWGMLATAVGTGLYYYFTSSSFHDGVNKFLFGHETPESVKALAENFWTSMKQMAEDMFKSTADIDPTAGSAHGPGGGLLGRLFRGPGGMGPTGPAVGAAKIRDDIAQMLGVSNLIASAFTSNFQAESGLHPDVTYGGGGYNPGSSLAYGLAQWTGTRRAALEKFAAERGLDVRSEMTQLMFLKYELGSKFPTMLATLRSMEARGASATQLADYIFSNFEVGPPESRAGHIGPAEAISALPHESVAASSTTSNGGVVLNHQSTITVGPVPNADAAAIRVGQEQTRVNQQMFHHAQNARR